MKKITLDLYIISPPKINSKLMKVLNVNNKNVKKNLSKNQGDYIFDLKPRETLLTRTGRPEAI